jgi:hypothetical protein
MKRLPPVVLVLLVVVLVLAASGGAYYIGRSSQRSTTPTPPPQASALPVTSGGSGFSVGGTPPIVPLASDWPPVTLANSDVHFSYPPTWSADTTSSPGALVLAPADETKAEPSPSIGFVVLDKPIDTAIHMGGQWTPITVQGMRGYYAQS